MCPDNRALSISVDKILLGDVYLVKILTKKELWSGYDFITRSLYHVINILRFVPNTTVVGEQPYKSRDMEGSDSGLGPLLVSSIKF